MNGILFPNGNEKHYDPKQLEIKYFWPLTEQIPLELDYTGCAREITYTSSYTIGSGVGTTWVSAVTNITPQLTISPNDPTGYIQIGGVNIGLEKKPNILQRVIHKLLGFDWKDK